MSVLAENSRGRFLRGAGIVGSAFLLAGCGGGTVVPEILQTPNVESDVEVLKKYVIDQGISVDVEEQKLWTQAYQKDGNTYPVDDSSATIIGKRLNQTVEIMGLSHNQYLKEAADGLAMVTFDVKSTLATGSGKPIFMEVGHEIQNGQEVYVVVVNADILLNNSSGQMLALSLAHEMEHVRQYQDFVASLPAGLSVEEIDKRLGEHLSKNETQVANESGAYAIQAQATFLMLGKVGGLNLPNEYWHEVAEYIRCGRDENSQCWRDFAGTRVNK